jgi:PEP-CTERM motif
MGNRIGFAALLAVMAWAAPAGAQGLLGATVTAAGYCCSAPVEENRLTDFVTASVGDTVEFPLGSLRASTIGIIPAQIDVSDTSISVTNMASATAGGGGFNGIVFDFQGAPAILGVAVDPSSTTELDAWRVTYTPNSVRVDAAGTTGFAGTTAVIDVLTSAVVPTIPEPATSALMLAGLAALFLTLRPRR